MMSSSVSGSPSSENFGNSAMPRQNFGSSAERSQSSPRTPPPPKSRSSAERVVNGECELQKIAEKSRLFTDHLDLFPFGLCAVFHGSHQDEVERLLKYSVSLEIGMITSNKQKNDAEGQACFITTQHGIVMATVKHNFCQEYNKDGNLEECLSVALTTPGSDFYSFRHKKLYKLQNWDARFLEHGDKDAFKFNSTENADAGWKYGKELAFIPLNDPIQNGKLMEDIEQGKISTFEAVSTTFECKVGMQVGIMACSCVNLIAKSMQSGLRSGDYEAQRGDTFITVGTITHVGADHIEYSINTVPGFSGAPVFLLQPGDEQHMKLIAVHAGFSEALGMNFGFLVSKKVEKYRAEQTCCVVS